MEFDLARAFWPFCSTQEECKRLRQQPEQKCYIFKEYIWYMNLQKIIPRQTIKASSQVNPAMPINPNARPATAIARIQSNDDAVLTRKLIHLRLPAQSR